VADDHRLALEPPDDLLLVAGDLPDPLAANTSGCAFASATVSGSSGHPGVNAT
jgi:hypothetical protein